MRTNLNRQEAVEYRKLGDTGLDVSTIGFGASPLGGAFGAIDPEEGTRAVHFAIDAGINFFDVSPYYGLTLAEERLGNALAGKREKVVLSTKCGRYGEHEFDFSAKRVARSIEDSLRRLKTDFVDLLQVHDLEFGDLEQVIHETVPAMRRLQEQGKARFIGITGYPLGALLRVAQAAPVDAVLSYCHSNLLIEDMHAALAPFCREQGIGLINASSLHMGILTEAGAPAWHPAPEAVKRAGRDAAAYCRARGLDIAEVAVRYSLDSADVASTLVGMATMEQVEANLRVLRMRTDPDLIAQLKELMRPGLGVVWASGRLENQDTQM